MKDYMPCRKCSGTGKIKIPTIIGRVWLLRSKVCSKCNGTGEEKV